MREKYQAFLRVLALFASLSTLICCAFPIVLTVIASAAVVSALVAAAPWLVRLTLYKTWFFVIAAILLILNAVLLYYYRFRESCPVDAKEECETGKSAAKTLFWISVSIYITGFFFAYLFAPIMIFLTS